MTIFFDDDNDLCQDNYYDYDGNFVDNDGVGVKSEAFVIKAFFCSPP